MDLFIFLLIILSATLLVLAIFFVPKKQVAGVKPFIISLFLVAVWNGMYAANLLCNTLNTKMILFAVNFAFIVYIPSCWLILTLEVTGTRKFENWRNLLIVIIPSITALIVLTSPYQNWFITHFALKPALSSKVLVFDKGFWFWINAAYNYLLNIISIGLLLKGVFSKQYTLKKQAFAMLAAMFFPIVFDIIYVGVLEPRGLFDVTPVSFWASLIISGYAISKYGFMSVIPIAREHTFDAMDELMIVIDKSLKIADMNKKAMIMLDKNIAEAVGMPIQNLIHEITDEVLNHSSSGVCKIRIKQNIAGETIYYYGSVSQIMSKDNELLGYLILLQNITQLTLAQHQLKEANQELGRLNEKLYNESIRDGLTGIFNKKHITLLLQKEIEKHLEESKKLSIILLDINFFKQFNDEYGHLTGDRILREVAELIDETIGENLSAGRFGGEEFLVVLKDMDKCQAVEIGECIRTKIESFCFGQEEKVTVSAGIAQCETEDSINSLLKRADDCLYKAKANGRNRIEIA